MSYLKKIVLLFIFLISTLSITILINDYNFYPNDNEELNLKNYFKSIKITTEDDLIKFQNSTIDSIKHECINKKTSLCIDSIIFYKKGYCYDRSILMQKYLLTQNFRVRPIYIYRNYSNNRIIDFFKLNLNSHNLFEIYFNNKWYVIRTNAKIIKLESLNEYLNSNTTFAKNSFYIKYLFSRNSYFIEPFFLPDIIVF